MRSLLSALFLLALPLQAAITFSGGGTIPPAEDPKKPAVFPAEPLLLKDDQQKKEFTVIYRARFNAAKKAQTLRLHFQELDKAGAPLKRPLSLTTIVFDPDGYSTIGGNGIYRQAYGGFVAMHKRFCDGEIFKTGEWYDFKLTARNMEEYIRLTLFVKKNGGWMRLVSGNIQSNRQLAGVSFSSVHGMDVADIAIDPAAPDPEKWKAGALTKSAVVTIPYGEKERSKMFRITPGSYPVVIQLQLLNSKEKKPEVKSLRHMPYMAKKSQSCDKNQF